MYICVYVCEFKKKKGDYVVNGSSLYAGIFSGQFD